MYWRHFVKIYTFYECLNIFYSKSILLQPNTHVYWFLWCLIFHLLVWMLLLLLITYLFCACLHITINQQFNFSYLFWTEWGQMPCIGKARLDGSEKVVLVSMGIAWPNGISIDYEVCWIFFLKYLECINCQCD